MSELTHTIVLTKPRRPGILLLQLPLAIARVAKQHPEDRSHLLNKSLPHEADHLREAVRQGGPPGWLYKQLNPDGSLRSVGINWPHDIPPTALVCIALAPYEQDGCYGSLLQSPGAGTDALAAFDGFLHLSPEEKRCLPPGLLRAEATVRHYVNRLAEDDPDEFAAIFEHYFGTPLIWPRE